MRLRQWRQGENGNESRARTETKGMELVMAINTYAMDGIAMLSLVMIPCYHVTAVSKVSSCVYRLPSTVEVPSAACRLPSASRCFSLLLELTMQCNKPTSPRSTTRPDVATECEITGARHNSDVADSSVVDGRRGIDTITVCIVYGWIRKKESVMALPATQPIKDNQIKIDVCRYLR